MAKIASLCCIMVLAMFAGFGVASNTTISLGTITYQNLASYDVTYSNDFEYNDGSSQIQSDVASKGQILEFDIISPDTTCVGTTFTMGTPAGHYSQNINCWCIWEDLTCMPNCFWVVDDKGFSVANSANSSLQFVSNWSGPHP